MQLAERIEKRRFVGREFLLWLWFEGELFDETLFVAPHGKFGLAIEKELLLSNGKEATRIVGRAPARAREAKDALALGKLPERAGLRLVLGEREATFVLKAEALGLAGLALPTILTEADAVRPGELGATTAPRRGRRRTTVEEDAEREADARAEVFGDRIDRAGEVEAHLEALYRDFLRLRLTRAWDELVVPAMRRWSSDEAVDAERYREARKRALAGTTSKAPRRKGTEPSKPTKRPRR
ncbi:MAG: hypothetical protein FJ095_16315 [Deltaproteobacteria bacterium]|nr:hypothetical protein [Deltaproteobacteria bacterium]